MKGVVVTVGLSAGLSAHIADVEGVLDLLRTALGSTQFVLRPDVEVSAAESAAGHDGLWFLVVAEPRADDAPSLSLIEVTLSEFMRKHHGRNALATDVDDIRKMHQSVAAARIGLTEMVRMIGVACGWNPRHRRGTAQARLTSVLAEQLVWINLFNGEHAQAAARPAQAWEHHHYIKAFHTEPVGPEVEHFHRAGMIADERASHYQNQWQQLLLGPPSDILKRGAGAILLSGNAWGLVRIGLAVSMTFALFSELPDTLRHLDVTDQTCAQVGFWLFWLWLSLLIAGVLRHRHAIFRRLEHRHQDYRLLAEYIRVQYVWTILGLPARVSSLGLVPPHAASGWVHAALRHLETRLPHSMAGLAPRAREEWACKEFIESQISYHEKVLVRLRSDAQTRLKGLAARGLFAFKAGTLALAVAVFFELRLPDQPWPSYGHHAAVLLIIGGLAVWAALTKVCETYAWEAEAVRGEIVLGALRRARARLEAGQSTAATVFAECGAVFANDQAIWHALHRSKPIEAPLN